MLRFHADDELNRVLNLVNAHSRSAARGVDAVLLSQASARSGGLPDVEPLLDRLVQCGLLERAGRCVRPTVEGYELLIRDDLEDDGKPLEGAATPHGPMSEYTLRGLLLDLLASNRLKARGQIQAAVLAEQWDSGRHRAGDLRLAIDLLIRDGQLSVGRFRKTRFRLEPDGYEYLMGRKAPAPLAAASPRPDPAAMNPHDLDQASLRAMVAYQFRGDLADEPMSQEMLMYLLERQFALDERVAHHAVEVAHRFGIVDWNEERGMLELTEAGARLREQVDAGRLPLAVSERLGRAAQRAEGGQS